MELPITAPQVTVVVVPRERFSYTRESLESIYNYTEFPFELIYIDGGSPENIKSYLQRAAQEKGFKLIRTDSYLSPNSARNLGLASAHSKYVVFIDNDVVVSPGWLHSLFRCAEETGATVVSPIICQGMPLHEIVHCAGGEVRIWLDKQATPERRRLSERIYGQGQPLATLRAVFRQVTGLAEFHCMLVRRQFLSQVGLMDEAMLNTKEHIDFCLSVAMASGSIYLEPTSVVTYVPPTPLLRADIPFYLFRWNDTWQLASLHRLRDKWNLTEDEYFQRRYKMLGWRRQLSSLHLQNQEQQQPQTY